jgi:hypothetical protein
LKEGQRLSAKNVRRVRTLCKKGDAKLLGDTPGVPALVLFGGQGRKEREGQERERRFFSYPAKEDSRDAKAQESSGSTRVLTINREQDAQLISGAQTVEAWLAGRLVYQ